MTTSNHVSIIIICCSVLSIQWTTIFSLDVISRRRAVQFGITGTTSVVAGADKVVAARGAAELDFEYYVRDLVGGNKKEGNVLPSAPPPISPPRRLGEIMIPLLLNEPCSIECTSTSSLVDRVQKSVGGNVKSIEKSIQDGMNNYRDRAEKSFYAREPWHEKSIYDQYYFDLTAYSLWRTAANLLPNYAERELFVRRLGKSIFDKLIASGTLKQSPAKNRSVVATIPCIQEILDLFTKSNFCKGYRLGESVPKGGQSPIPLFDDFDDDAIASGAGIDCLISIFEPATLGASLQITGEQSRFVPDFIGPILAAMWEQAGIQVTWEVFFVDPVYRPNPKDYFPNEQLYQFSLISRKALS